MNLPLTQLDYEYHNHIGSWGSAHEFDLNINEFTISFESNMCFGSWFEALSGARPTDIVRAKLYKRFKEGKSWQTGHLKLTNALKIRKRPDRIKLTQWDFCWIDLWSKVFHQPRLCLKCLTIAFNGKIMKSEQVLATFWVCDGLWRFATTEVVCDEPVMTVFLPAVI